MICRSPLWDLDLTWYTSYPLFTPCLEDVIATIPVALLVVALCLNFVVSKLSKNEPQREIHFLDLGRLPVLKMFVVLSLFGIHFVQGIKAFVTEDTEWAQVLSPAILLFGDVCILIHFWKNLGSNVHNSGIEFGFWLLTTLSQAILFRTAVYYKIYGANHTLLLFPRLFTFPLVAFRFILELIPANSTEKQKTKQILSNPDKSSTFLSRILFIWYDNLAWAGYRRTLTSDDLWELQPTDSSAVQCGRISANGVCAEMENPKNQTTVFIAILKTYGGKYFRIACLKIFGAALVLTQPFAIRLLIHHVSSPEEEAWKGYLYLGVIVTTVVVSSIIVINSDKMTQLLCLQVKTALTNAVFRKALKISNTAKTKQSSVGAMMNLISVDVQKLVDFFYIHGAVPALLVTSVCTYILYSTLGHAAFVGLGTLVAVMLFSNFLTISIGAKLQREGMKFRDERMRITSEVLGGIKVLKFYGWELPFEKKILGIRQKELGCVWKVSWILSVASALYVASPILVSIATFTYYVLVDPENVLTPTKVFVLINIMNILKGYVVILPVAFMYVGQIYVSMKRLTKFFHLEELEFPPEPENPEYPVVIQNASFAWIPEKTTLENISLKLEQGKLAAVVGRIGSGKSSLLAAILGEMKKTSGTVQALNSVAYVAQTPWIQNASLRDNILFGSPYNPVKYEAVINACALTDDIRLLPGGDLTEIGESGTNLSGGQKQRVGLARAAYSDASLYLLDDPLSAVDANVGRHIFEKLLGNGGLLNQKTRLLVTHNVYLLPNVDKIFVLKDGRLTESGTYQELLHGKGEFSDYLVSLRESSAAQEETPRNIEHAGNEGRDTSATSNVATKIVATETSAVGTIKFKYYFRYFTSAGIPVFFLAVLFFAVSEGMAGFNNLYLSNWSSSELSAGKNTPHNMTSMKQRLTQYVLLGCVQCLTTFCAFAFLTIIAVVAAKNLHANALRRILRCPMSYFDTTLRGNLFSRFSRDVEVTDFPILHQLRLVCAISLCVIVTIVIICITTPLFLLALLPISIIYIIFQRFYVATSRQLKRIESVSRSPIFSHFSETLAGVNTIRAFGVEKQFVTECENRIDANQKCSFAFAISVAWVSLRLELLGATVVFFTTLFVLLGRGDIDPGSAGLALTYALSITVHLNLVARLSSDLENNLVSVERLSELTETPQEKDWEIQENKPDKSWPETGNLKFDCYGTRYRDGLDLVLKGISFEIGAGEKVGVVGRTGAGKSSLALALFRIIEATQGKIFIDGIDVSTLGLQDLRKKMTIIPQDPLLFSGTLRENLDPFGEHCDEEQWKCLELAHLKTKFTAQSGGLDFKVDEDGKNLSIGERQLICLARALLRRSRILILDEATAAIDLETDELVQTTIRQEFSKSTVLTIAHRLNTVMDSDRILVMSKGEVLEFDTPSNLLRKPESAFSDMLRNTHDK